MSFGYFIGNKLQIEYLSNTIIFLEVWRMLWKCYDPLARDVKGKQHKPDGIGKSKNIY